MLPPAPEGLFLLQIPSVALAYEKAESDIMNRRPRNKRRDRLVNQQLAVYSYLQIGGLASQTLSCVSKARLKLIHLKKKNPNFRR